MPSSSFVESGFWCFDALFVPQQHPAREVQDTFYLSDPSTSLPPPKDYYERVSTVHTQGGHGSTGYRAPWNAAESHKLLLRTHTTASSAHMLYKLAARCRGEAASDDEFDWGGTSGRVERKEGIEDDGFRPAKLFSIDRVFRNETMDATHLAEFHQVEGVVADRGLTLADLIGKLIASVFEEILAWSLKLHRTVGFMRVFFKKMGIENLRFKPAYNPYTEVCLVSALTLHPASPPAHRAQTKWSPHIALAGDLRFPPAPQQMGRSRQQRHVPPRDAGADGLPEGRPRPRLGHQPRAADHDQVRPPRLSPHSPHLSN